MPATEFKQRATVFCDLLLQKAHFDEAHWVNVALQSPTLCDSEYAANALRRARALAVQHGMQDLAVWISTLV